MNNTEIKYKALIIDDEIDICYLLTGILKNNNIPSVYVNSLQSAEEVLNTYIPSIIFLDNHLKDGFGIDFIKYIRKKCPETKILVITAHDSTIDRIRAFSAGAIDFITKPFSMDRIHIILRNIKHS